MGWNDEEDTRIYRAVVNHEEQYSIWPADRELPLGWNDAGKTGTKQEVLAYEQMTKASKSNEQLKAEAEAERIAMDANKDKPPI